MQDEAVEQRVTALSTVVNNINNQIKFKVT